MPERQRLSPHSILTAGLLALALASSAAPGWAAAQCEVPVDVDADGEITALSDGLLVLRWLFGFRGAVLVNGAVDLGDCTRCGASEIDAFLSSLGGLLDVDGSGQAAALTDGLLVLRALFGFTGASLVSSAVDFGSCERCTALAIEVYVDSMTAFPQEPLDVWEQTTVPFDLDCPDGCDELEHTDALAHLGFDVTYHYNADIDDPIAQWGDCLGSMLECLEMSGDVGACAANAACPAECKSLYAQRAPQGADQSTLLQVLNGVYVDCGAPCRPLEEVAP